MKTLYLAAKLLWKRRWANLTLVSQLLISIVMFAQLFVFVSDWRGSVDAVEMLPVEDTVILSIYPYYTPQFVCEELAAYDWVESIGTVGMDYGVCGQKSCNLAVYSAALLQNYPLPLQAGTWLTGESVSGDPIPGVVSADMELHIGDIVDVTVTGEGPLRIVVQGILQPGVQYLYPAGSASPEYFSADSIIGREPVVILASSGLPAEIQTLCETLFVFLEEKHQPVEQSLSALYKYGEAAQMNVLISNYEKNQDVQITGSAIMFAVFFLLAMTGGLCNAVLQNLQNRACFTIYYLLGMDWKKGVAIEAFRLLLLLGIVFGVSLAAGNWGLLMLDWMEPVQKWRFFLAVFLYLLVMLLGTNFCFLWKLMKTDISASLKALQQGE